MRAGLEKLPGIDESTQFISTIDTNYGLLHGRRTWWMASDGKVECVRDTPVTDRVYYHDTPDFSWRLIPVDDVVSPCSGALSFLTGGLIFRDLSDGRRIVIGREEALAYWNSGKMRAFSPPASYVPGRLSPKVPSSPPIPSKNPWLRPVVH